MSDSDASTPPEFFSLAADIFDLHPLSGLCKIEMHVDFGIEIARDGKYPIDLRARVGVEIRRRADRTRAPTQTRDQQFLGAGIIGKPLLRENAQFDIHGPGVVARELLDRFETDHSDARIDLDMRAHVHGALRD